MNFVDFMFFASVVFAVVLSGVFVGWNLHIRMYKDYLIAAAKVESGISLDLKLYYIVPFDRYIDMLSAERQVQRDRIAKKQPGVHA